MGDDGRVVGNIVPPNAPTLFQLHPEGINSYPPSRLVDLRNIMDPSDVVSHPNNGASLVF